MRLSFYTISALMAIVAVDAIQIDQAVKLQGDPKDV